MKPETFEKNKGIPPHVPEHLNKLKEFLLKRYDAVREERYEADDLIGIAAHELELLGKPLRNREHRQRPRLYPRRSLQHQ